MGSTLEDALAWAERKMKTDLHYLLSGGFWSGVGQVAVTLCSLAFSLIAARYIPKDVYGDYKYIIAVVSIISSFSLNGLPGAVLQSTASGHDGVLPEGFRENLRWSTAIFALSIATGGYYLFVGDGAIGLGILLGGCITPFMASANLYGSYLNGKKDFKRATIYADFIGTPIPVVLLILVALIDPQPFPLIATYFVSNAAVTFYAYWRTLRIYRPPLHNESDRGMLSYAKHLSVMGILGGIAGNIDQVLLFHWASAVDLAIYNFATGVVDQTKGPLKSLDSMMQARFAPRADLDIASGIRNKMLWLFVAALVFIALYIPLAPFIYKFLFPAYAVAVPYSQVYALSMIALVFSPAGSYLEAKRKVGAQYISTIFTSLLQIVAMTVGVIYWGLWGIIIARVFIRVVGSGLIYVLYLGTPTV